MNYKKLSFLSFHLNTSLIPTFNYSLLTLDLSFKLMYRDLEYDN